MVEKFGKEVLPDLVDYLARDSKSRMVETQDRRRGGAIAQAREPSRPPGRAQDEQAGRSPWPRSSPHRAPR